MREAQARCDAREFAEWLAEYRIEPFGEERADLRMAILASTIANSNPYRKGPAIKASQFMPEFGKKKTMQNPVHLEQMAKMFAVTHNKSVTKTKPAPAKPKKKT